MHNYINFKKQREIGEVINDTFKFLRENYKPLFSLIFKIAGPPFLFLLLASGYYMYVTFDMFDSLTGSSILDNDSIFTPDIFLALWMVLITLILYFCFLYGTVLNFIKSYIKNQGEVNELEVRHGAKSNLMSILGAGFITAILVFVGLLFFFLPGIYLMVPLSLVFSILVFEGRGVFDSISHCFTLIKENWWVTFATLLVMWLLMYLIGIIFSLPAIFYGLVQGFTMTDEVSAANPAGIFNWVYIALNLVSTIAQYLLYTVTVVSTAFIYFNLNERKNYTGTYESIENLGKKE